MYVKKLSKGNYTQFEHKDNVYIYCIVLQNKSNNKDFAEYLAVSYTHLDVYKRQALGMTMFLSAFLASGRMLQQGEEQMAGYYDSRNQLENNRTAEQASGRSVLELEASGTGGMQKSLASNAYQTGTQTNYRTGPVSYTPLGAMIDSVSREAAGFAELPHKFEAGTVNGGGAVGL